MPIAALESDEVSRVTPDATLLEVAAALAEAEVGLLVVTDQEGKVRGVVSERDIVRSLAQGHDPGVTKAIDIAHTEIAWCDATATVAEVAEEMMERYIRHVLVEDEGRLVGVVSARDLLGAYASADEFAD